MPNRLVVMGFLALFSACAALAALWQHAEATRYREVAERQTELVLALQERLDGMRQRMLALAQEQAEQQQNLKETLNAVPEWSDAPVPSPVVERLCSVLRCRKP